MIDFPRIIEMEGFSFPGSQNKASQCREIRIRDVSDQVFDAVVRFELANILRSDVLERDL